MFSRKRTDVAMALEAGSDFLMDAFEGKSGFLMIELFRFQRDQAFFLPAVLGVTSAASDTLTLVEPPAGEKPERDFFVTAQAFLRRGLELFGMAEKTILDSGVLGMGSAERAGRLGSLAQPAFQGQRLSIQSPGDQKSAENRQNPGSPHELSVLNTTILIISINVVNVQEKGIRKRPKAPSASG
jgi:hypothetical protein